MSTDHSGDTVGESAGAWIGSGGGPVLVLLHGLTGTWHIWRPLLRLLESRYRVLALTLPGHAGGPAYRSAEDATVAGLAEQLVAEFAARGIQRAHVVGNSIGGWLALELARRGFALSVTAFSPAGGWNTDKEYRQIARPFKIFYLLMPLVLFLTTLFLRFAAVRKLLCKTTMEHGDRIPEDDLRDSLRAFAGTRILPGLLRSMGRDGPIAPLAAGPTPIRIVWSELDQVIPFERYGVPMLARVDGARAETLPGAGHVPMYDAPELMVRHIDATVAEGEALLNGGLAA